MMILCHHGQLLWITTESNFDVVFSEQANKRHNKDIVGSTFIFLCPNKVN